MFCLAVYIKPCAQKKMVNEQFAIQNETNLGYPADIFSVKLQVRVPIQVLVQETY